MVSVVRKQRQTLADFFEWIWERTARGSAAEADARTQALHHRAIETVRDALEAQVLRIRGLHLVLPERLHLDDVLGSTHAVMVTVRLFSHLRRSA